MRLSEQARSLLRLLGALVLCVAVLPALPVSADEPVWEFLTESRTLSEDHVGGIHVKGDNVTLDCDGYSILWTPGDEEAGVLVEGFAGVTIKNCVIEGYEHGVHVTGSSDILIKNTVSRSIVFGFFVGGFHPDHPEYESHHVTLINSSAIGINDAEGIGFFIEAGHDITLKNNVAVGHYDNGFRVEGPAHDNLLIGNRAESNGSHGFEVHGYFDDATSTALESTGNVLRGNVSIGNGVLHGGSGFKIGEYATMNTLENNRASQNRWSGFFLNEYAHDNLLVGNRSFDNVWLGFWVSWYSPDNQLVRNIAMRNGGGFYAGEYSPGTLLESNLFCNNQDGAIAYDEQSEPILSGNKFCNDR